MESEETAKSFKFKKFLYGGMFNDDGDMLLCKDGEELRMPGGQIYVADICPFINEKWVPAFLSRRIEVDTGIAAFLVVKNIQQLAATYNVYSDNFKEEHSAIIVGNINSCLVLKVNTLFFSAQDILTQRIKNPQQFLIMRMFASRDCPNQFSRKIAGKWLKSHT
ncbi:MAG TPA: hypothetical protein PLD14_03490 [Candidatus Pacearchaeota archaeon]|nr:hypothetical protein [Candidatus Pacearchaeota archaeon]HPR80259.1 hypothetical protein [Candidatus Pacearchaeota archaeon]